MRKVAAVALFALIPCISRAALHSNSFVCSVQPGYTSPSMPLGIKVEPERILVSISTSPPTVGVWRLLDSNAIGLAAASGGGYSVPNWPAGVTASVIVLMRESGIVRWIEVGADRDPIVDRIGTCADAP